MNSECPLQKLKWNSFCSFQWRKDKERRIFVILLLKRRHLMYVNVFWFCRYNFFTDDGCEHAKMKQFTFVAGNIRSQYTLFWNNRWIFHTKLQSRLAFSGFSQSLSYWPSDRSKVPRFPWLLAFREFNLFFFNFLESLSSESHWNFPRRTSDFSFWCQVPLITRNLPEVLPIVQIIGVGTFFNGGGGEEEVYSSI